MKARPHLTIAANGLAALLLTGAALSQTPAPEAVPKMKAVIYREFGSPSVLRLEEIAKPVPNDNQVLVKVRANSVNPLDWHYMEGTPYLGRLPEFGVLKPNVTRLGVDYAGTVEAVGKNVKQYKPGDEVFGNRFGAFAEYICATEKALALKPANLTFEQAASVPVAGITALQGLRDTGKLQAGQRVLINGASGGVGTFAVQLAKWMGANVTGVCSTRNVELVRSLGADQVIDYTKEDFTKGAQRYDLILDNVANRSLAECRDVLNPNGRYVMVGGGGVNDGVWVGPLPRVIKALLWSRLGSQQMGPFLAEVNNKDLTILGDLMQAGTVKPVIDRRYKLDDVAEAIRYLEGGHARGKVVITLDPNAEVPPIKPERATAPAVTPAPALIAAGLIGVPLGVLIVPIILAFVFNRRFQRRNPGKRPYRWGYYFAIQSIVAGLGLGFMLESGLYAVLACAVLYAVLAWCFARRQRWAWIALTILSFNPIAWIINLIYLWKRWAEASASTTTV
jgi:NADPH:quinone reductase-like Zn-dependent oxidoreductase